MRAQSLDTICPPAYRKTRHDRAMVVHLVNTLFNPEVHTLALDYEAQGSDRRVQTENVGGLNNELLVGPAGLEPTTSTV